MTSTLQSKSMPVVKIPKGRSLTRFLAAMGVTVTDAPKREHIEQAHRIFRHARGQSVEVNNLWNFIKRHVCPVCDGVKLRAKSATCSVICGMSPRRKLMTLLCVLCVSVANAQRGTLTAVSTQPSAKVGTLSLVIPPFKQPAFEWTNPVGASNVTVSWGLMRFHWTNGTANIGISNSFKCTNGWHYVVTARIDDRESTPALWPSNRYDRIWIQTSTNLTTWQDAYIWTTNFNLPQEFLRHRAELIRWE